MAALGAILEAMADQIRDTMTAEADWYVQVEPTMVLNPTPPVIDMYPADPSIDSNTGSHAATLEAATHGFWINVRARVNPNDHDANQDVLVEFLDPASDVSVVQALYDDPTLNGLASDLNLDSQTGFVLVPKVDGSAVHVGVIWRFLVIPAYS